VASPFAAHFCITLQPPLAQFNQPKAVLIIKYQHIFIIINILFKRMARGLDGNTGKTVKWEFSGWRELQMVNT